MLFSSPLTRIRALDSLRRFLTRPHPSYVEGRRVVRFYFEPDRFAIRTPRFRDSRPWEFKNHVGILHKDGLIYVHVVMSGFNHGVHFHGTPADAAALAERIEQLTLLKTGKYGPGVQLFKSPEPAPAKDPTAKSAPTF